MPPFSRKIEINNSQCGGHNPLTATADTSWLKSKNRRDLATIWESSLRVPAICQTMYWVVRKVIVSAVISIFDTTNLIRDYKSDSPKYVRGSFFFMYITDRSSIDSTESLLEVQILRTEIDTDINTTKKLDEKMIRQRCKIKAFKTLQRSVDHLNYTSSTLTIKISVVPLKINVRAV
ncbi:hypothetical protein WN51_00344 [Melipona quadrifasciata]|uniref:Uncharacterized protein n=1 Tax=Melipona quadrifasciata TaxID=166423 RepID=A0A0M9A086_9HYME|nr:hypothetical protein WN51_00344 [Melipona quadrifasciata]